MTRLLLLVGLGAALGYTSTAAQSASTEAKDKDTITVTGCLQAGSTSDTFTLSNATEASAASSPTGTSGSSTTGSPGASGSSRSASSKYELTASGTVDLKPHVGHKVEITGTPDKSAVGTSGSSSSTTTGAGSSAAETKKLKVTAVKHLAASCS